MPALIARIVHLSELRGWPVLAMLGCSSPATQLLNLDEPASDPVGGVSSNRSRRKNPR
jgi:hypothetical protein